MKTTSTSNWLRWTAPPSDMECQEFFPSPCKGEDEGEGPCSASDSFRSRFKIPPSAFDASPVISRERIGEGSANYVISAAPASSLKGEGLGERSEIDRIDVQPALSRVSRHRNPRRPQVERLDLA